MQIKLIDYMGSDLDIVKAAKVSYGKQDEIINDNDVERLINFLYRNEHFSPFEMAELKFYVKVPIFVARQLMRYRTASVNEISGRYKKITPEYFELTEFRVNSKTNKQKSEKVNDYIALNKSNEIIKSVYEFIKEKYDILNKFNLAKELTRIILPLGQYTEFYFKIDLRNFFNICKQRLHHTAQAEIRELIKNAYEQVKEKFPLACKAFEIYELNAIKFSEKELNVLKKYFNNINLQELENDLNNFQVTEKDEFIEKISKLKK